MSRILYVILLLCSINSTALWGQAFSADDRGNLVVKGVEVFEKSVFSENELFEQFVHVLDQKNESTKFESFKVLDLTRKRIIYKFEHPYYFEDYSKSAGVIQFFMDVRVMNNSYSYTLYRFEHKKSHGELESIGGIPASYSGNLIDKVSQDVFNEIVWDINLNIYDFVQSNRQMMLEEEEVIGAN